MSETEVIINPIKEWMEYCPITLHKPMSREEFIALSDRYPEWQMEREGNGKIIIMTPVKKGSGKRESIVLIYVGMWVFQNKEGEVFSPSTGIELPDGSIRCPDCAWVSDERLAALPDASDEDFLKAVPDFIVEVRSQSDNLTTLKKKMTKTWMANGVRLAWLIDPYEEKVWIYREGKKVKQQKGFKGIVLNGEAVMPGMELPLDELMRKKK
jgi:Uma2 family endonuclease